jgi:hypothetical protein
LFTNSPFNFPINNPPGGQTLEGCAAWAVQFSSTYFGVGYQYGSYYQCVAYGNFPFNLPSGAFGTINKCTYRCPGNTKELCGGWDGTNTYYSFFELE